MFTCNDYFKTSLGGHRFFSILLKTGSNSIPSGSLKETMPPKGHYLFYDGG